LRYWLYIAIIGGIVFGIFVPHLQAYKPAVPYLIGFILAFNFLEITFSWKNFLRKELTITLLLSAVIMPVIAYYLLTESLYPEFRVGLLITALAPSGVMPLVFGRFIKYVDYDLVLSNFLITTFGSILYLPAMVKWLAGTDIDIPSGHLLFKTALIILLPYGASIIMKNAMKKELLAMVKNYVNTIILVSIFIICSIVGSSASGNLVWSKGLIQLVILVFAVYLIQGGLAYMAGYILWDKPARNTLALISSSRNNQITLGIAILNFPPATAIPCIIGFLLHHLTNAIWLWLFRK
jgi:predicted Na+-dependent transporter